MQGVGPRDQSEILLQLAARCDGLRAHAGAAGLEVVALEECALRVEFFDVGAVVHFLRKVLWTVPGFTPEAYDAELRRLHEQIERQGSFVSTARRVLVEARRPGTR